jgi:hypothetical protein
MRCKAEVGESNIGLFRLPLNSFTESSGFSVCSYSEADILARENRIAGERFALRTHRTTGALALS